MDPNTKPRRGDIYNLWQNIYTPVEAFISVVGGISESRLLYSWLLIADCWLLFRRSALPVAIRYSACQDVSSVKKSEMILFFGEFPLKMLHQCNLWCTSVIVSEFSHRRGSETFYFIVKSGNKFTLWKTRALLTNSVGGGNAQAKTLRFPTLLYTDC